MARSQVWSLVVAMASVIEARAPLQALLASPGIYNGLAPLGTPMPYITFGLIQENADNVFGKSGSLAGVLLDIWTGTTSPDGTSQSLGNAKCLQIYDQLVQAFHEVPIAVTGFTYCFGKMSLIATMEDPDGLSFHGIARFDITQRVST